MATTLIAVLGAATAWAAAGLPIPAMQSYVDELRAEMITSQETVIQRIASVEKFNMDTRAIVLSFEWERLFKQIEAMENQETLSQSDEALLVEWKIKLRRVQQQLDNLNHAEDDGPR